MFTRKLNNSKRGLLAASLLAALVLWMAPATFAADTGHIGGKPDIGQGDGISQSKPGVIREGEQLAQGDASMGDDPASEGGDGIPNGGPIEGEGHQGKGGSDASSSLGFWSLLFGF